MAPLLHARHARALWPQVCKENKQSVKSQVLTKIKQAVVGTAQSLAG